ncbi:metal-dependent hydrolase [Patescibacteria group bacterium]|nr:metal-dependent hydrolase [Patescibacteria group bacterium]
MTGKTHQAIGLTAGTAAYLIYVTPVYGPASLAWVLVLSSLAALLPDVDQPGSKIWKILPFGKVGGELVNPFLQHRNLSHSLLGLALVAWGSHALLYLIPSYWGVNIPVVWAVFLISYASHLLADMVTVEGIPLLFPYQRMFGIPPYPLQGVRIETGGWFENLVIFPAVNLLFLVLLWMKWPVLHTLLFH